MRHSFVLCLTLACSSSPSPSAPARVARGIYPGDIDRSADPCTDFYQYASGAWRAANPIPAGQARWNRRLVAREANRRDLQALLEELASKRSAPGSPEQQLGDHFAACLDEAAVDAAGLTPLAPLLAELDGVRDVAGLARVIGRLHGLGVPAPFVAVGGFDYHDPARMILQILPGEPVASPRAAALLRLAGLTDAEAVLALEARLGEARLDAASAADPAKTAHPMRFAQLVELAPRFPWDSYFAEARLPRADLNVSEPAFLARLDRELEATPIAVWKGYLAWRLLEWASPWLARPFVDEAIARTPRAARCVESTEALLGEPLGRLYAERHFPPAAKARVQEMVRGLRAVLKEEIGALTWMSSAAREAALDKLGTYDVQVGYPDRWTDTSSIVIRPDAFFANVIAARRFAVETNRRTIGKRVSRQQWALPPSSPAAYIDVQLNQMVLPAGFLQPPLFDLTASDAANYGAAGAGIAHDLTHAIDTLGADFDAAGRPRPWWTEADRQAFAARAACVIAQHDRYLVEPGLPLDGKRVSGEAIGDLAGIAIAYRALERTHPTQVIDGFTPAQQFFLAWGQFRGGAESLEAQREMVKSDSHAPARYRVIGPLSHTPAFQEAFACRAGSPMVSQPRCAVW